MDEWAKDKSTVNETTIYYTSKSSRSNPATEILVLILGVVMLVWYVRGVSDAVRGDIHDFIPAFRSTPLLAVVFAFLKLTAYILFPALFSLMVYIPIRNL